MECKWEMRPGRSWGDQSVGDEIREILRGSKCGVQVGNEIREALGDQSVGDEIGEVLRGSKCGVQVGNEIIREVLGGSECGR